MLFHTKRLLADLRGLRLWLAAIAVTIFISSLVTSLMAAESSQALQQGSLSLNSPRKPLSFLRVLDPRESILQESESLEEGDVLATPGINLLLSNINKNKDRFVVLPLGALTSDASRFPQLADQGRAVVGPLPAMEAGDGVAGDALLFGSLDGESANITNSSLGPQALRQISATNLEMKYVAGNGYIENTIGDPLVMLDVATATALGVFAPYQVSDVINSFTCYCSAREMEEIARQMTAAERAAGSPRVFYAIAYEGLVGPVERATSATAIANSGFSVAVLLGVGGFTFMATHLFWLRRRHDYRTEWRSGAGRLALHARQQVVVLIAITLPAGLGYLTSQVILQSSAGLPSLSGSVNGIVFLLLAAVQGFCSLLNLSSMNRDFRIR